MAWLLLVLLLCLSVSVCIFERYAFHTITVFSHLCFKLVRPGVPILASKGEGIEKISREPKFIGGYADTVPRRERKIKERVGTLLTPCATSNLSKKVSLIKWVHKDLENSIVEFTEYLNSCVCLYHMLHTTCFGRNIYYLHISGRSCLSFTKLS